MKENQRTLATVAAVGLLLLVLFYGGFIPTPSTSGMITVRPYQTYIRFADGTEKYVDEDAPLKGMMLVEGGGSATSLGVDFKISGTVKRDNTALTDVTVSGTYTITCAEGSTVVKSTTGSFTFTSTGYTTTSYLTVSDSEFRSKLGTGTHTVTFTCGVAATATPAPGIVTSGSAQGGKSYSVDLSTYSMTVTVS